jgi:hypothetical protein
MLEEIYMKMGVITSLYTFKTNFSGAVVAHIELRAFLG